VTKKRPVRSGLDRERVRRHELDQSKAELRLPESATGLESSAPPKSDDAVAVPAVVRVLHEADAGLPVAGIRLPGQRVVCLWCGSSVAVKARGPLPKFCSATCRHRAWEQARAARDGRVAVVAVDRLVATYPKDARGWGEHLERLAEDVRRGQLDEGELTAALDLVYAAVARRQRRFRPDDPW